MKKETLCPRCKKPGFRTRRWVRSSYYARYGSIPVIQLQISERKLSNNLTDKRCQERVKMWRERVRGSYYRGKSKKGLIIRGEDEVYNSEENNFRTVSEKYYHDYFGHYDREKYKQQMMDYRSGKRKSRPNGRRWCKILKPKYFYF